MFLVLPSNLIAQDYKVHSNSDFNFYFTSETKPFISQIDSILRIELRYIQKRLNYHTNNPIDVFLIKERIPDYLLKNEVLKSYGGGVIVLNYRKVPVELSRGPQYIKENFRYRASRILVDEMMFGGAFQDKVKSANLMNLPDWVLPGLFRYLSTGWDATTDNSMRGIHELYGLTDYNKIPSRYDEIKGASFWKFMETKYGAKAIPTVMYMARFTRKFNQALYNSYQTSMSEVFVSWRDFYNRAYNADQIKPNPVGGLIFDEDLVSDFFINAVDEVYYIEEKWGGTSLYFMDLKTNERTKLYTLASDEFQIPEYGGAIAVYGDTISLLVNSESGARLVSILNDHIKKSQLGIGLASSLRVDKGKIFVLEADLLGSSVWEVLPVGIREAQKIEGFISSFDVDGQSWIWVE
ncbi:MAG: hypothetical protein ACPGTP_08685, partial [Bacteroidia bacterium]